METQKTSYIPTVNGVPVKDWDMANAFITDPIEFPYSIAWASQFIKGQDFSPVGSYYTIWHSNDNDFGNAYIYKDMSSISMETDANLIKEGSYFGARYMFIEYVTDGGPTGLLTLQLSK
jgi:hypothetical protein